MNKNLSALKNKLASISCVVAIFLIVSGMVFIMPVIADLVSTEEKDAYANAMTGEMIFDDYYVSHHGLNNSVIAISVFGQNGEQLSIDPTEYSKTLLLDLMHLEKGDPLQYVLDTETGFLLELTSSDTVIYQKNFGSVLAVFMGVVGAFVLAMGIFSLVLRMRAKQSKPSQTQDASNSYANSKEESATCAEDAFLYSVGAISKKSRWVFIACENGDALDDPVPFANLIKKIAANLNGGVWRGNILPSDYESRFTIKNDPHSLIYQYDTLYGIVVEYGADKPVVQVLSFLKKMGNVQPHAEKIKLLHDSRSDM